MDTVFFGRKAEKNAEGTPINDIDYPQLMKVNPVAFGVMERTP